MSVSSYNTVIIDLGAIQSNFKAIKQKVGPGVRVLPMIKSEAYGHGLVESARALVQAGADAFGVAEIEEGIQLREGGIKAEILIFLGSIYYDELIINDLTPVIFEQNSLERLSECAVKHDKKIGVHLKIDTGMGRLGIMPEEAASYLKKINTLPGLFLSGIISHFPKADEENPGPTISQNMKFREIVGDIVARPGSELRDTNIIVHAANSAASIRFPETYFNMVRPGIAIYGCHPSEVEDCRAQIYLKPAMSFSSKVVQIKDVPEGYGLSYGHVFVTKRPSRLAILPVGYADGFLRSLTGKAEVLINGQRAPVCGRVCMNASVVDITDIPGVEVFDDVVIMGRQKGDTISADEIAGWMGTINYEVLCLFGNNNQRIYI